MRVLQLFYTGFTKIYRNPAKHKDRAAALSKIIILYLMQQPHANHSYFENILQSRKDCTYARNAKPKRVQRIVPTTNVLDV